ncbi:hypothetical protein X943_003044 [Babesia divergens]|uniref:Uncharacterized protein n=1 Tax=Babesia divergens TaxID=32595 RepID=A0AAD9GBK9_BABDI|nr:hypothetical protein X943_003044 [Babesia divergens]
MANSFKVPRVSFKFPFEALVGIANFGTKGVKETYGVAKQSIIPRTGEQQIKKNVLEGCGGVMLNNIFNIVGNVLGSLIGETGSLLGKASGDKLRHLAIMRILLRTHKVKVIKRSVGLGEKFLKGLSNL